MKNQPRLVSNLSSFISSGQTGNKLSSYLVQEYERWQTLFQAQPIIVQNFIESQARSLAGALIQRETQARFSLPSSLVPADGSKLEMIVPPDQREQLVGGLMDRLTRTDLNTALRQRLDELEASTEPSIAAAAGLLRFVTTAVLVYEKLPSGRSVNYQLAEEDEIPSFPALEEQNLGSAITAATDAIVEEGNGNLEAERGELLVPYTPYARRFFLPQWVAFDDRDQLLVNSTSEAEAHLTSMQRFVRILHLAVALAPYMVVDEAYQQKRYGMLGQLVNQGRALARFETGEIIGTIKRRAAANDLNRGLSISLPFFDDQTLEMKSHYIDVIPAGRIMFIPALIVLAVRKEQAKVEQDTRLGRSTRRHVLAELHMLEEAFLSAGQDH